MPALAEAMWVLESVYERGPAEIATSIQMLFDHERLSLEPTEVVTAALAVFEARPRLGFSETGHGGHQ